MAFIDLVHRGLWAALSLGSPLFVNKFVTFVGVACSCLFLSWGT
jgi:hypothetical protein